MPISLSDYFSGFGLLLSLIVAIGPRNMFLLKQGLLRQHVGLAVVTCTLLDVLLIALGVTGLGDFQDRCPDCLKFIRYGGVIFLIVYGLGAVRSVLRGGGHLAISGAAPTHWARTALVAILVSLGNPHVYLDTVVLLGSVGCRLAWPGRGWFAAGAMSAAACWFSLVGWGAQLFTTVFSRELAWRILDGITALVMFTIAGILLLN